MQLRLPPEAIPAQAGYIPGLDGLRACSIMIVLVSHFFFERGGAGWGAIGVWIFFCLSGFLITRLMLAEKKLSGGLNVPAFYLRRFLRLYPVILVFLIVIVAFAAIRNLPIPGSEIASVLFYYVNYLIAHVAWGQAGPGGAHFDLPVGPLWSLAVEEHFYILMPLVFVAVRGSVRRLIAVALGITIASLALRYIYVLIWPEIIGKLVVYVRSDTRFDSIAIGVLLALVCELPGHRKIVAILSSRWAFALGCIVMIGSSAFRDPVFRETLRFTIRNIAAVPILTAIVFGQLGIIQTVLNSRPLVWLGRISYSLYVWHGGVEWMLENAGLGSHSYFVRGLVFSAVSLVIASASFYLLEKPLVSVRKRLEERKKVPAPGASSGFTS